MQHRITNWLAGVFGSFGAWLIAFADRATHRWPSGPPQHNYPGERDTLLTVRNAHTWPSAPMVPQIEEWEDDRATTRPCTPPPAMKASGERRTVLVDGKHVSVTPPAGSWWSAGGSS